MNLDGDPWELYRNMSVSISTQQASEFMTHVMKVTLDAKQPALASELFRTMSRLFAELGAGDTEPRWHAEELIEKAAEDMMEDYRGSL